MANYSNKWEFGGHNIFPSANVSFTIGNETTKWNDAWATLFHGKATEADLFYKIRVNPSTTPTENGSFWIGG